MKNTFPQSRTRIVRYSYVVVLAIISPSLGACTLEQSEAVAAAALPTPGSIEIVEPLVLADHARVPERESGFVSVQVKDNTLVVAHDGRLPSFAEGDVLAGTQSGGYLVRVAGVRTVDSEHVVLDTTPADVTELITEGHFRVHYDAQQYAREIDRYLEQVHELGEQDGEPVVRRAEALKIGSGAPVRLMHVKAAGLPASCGISAIGKAEVDATADLFPALDVELQIGRKGTFNPAPEVKHFRFVASGRIEMHATLRGAGTVAGDCSIDLLALAGGVTSLPLPALTFWVGPVPVVITSEVVPKASADVRLSFTATDVAAQARLTTELQAGVEYEDHAWDVLWEPSGVADGTASIETPGPITVSGKVSAGAELRARLYGVVGPNIGLQAYARATADTAPPYCTYDARVDGGVRGYAAAEVGAAVGPLHLTLARLDLVDLELLHVDGPHWSGILRDAPDCVAQP